MQYENWAKTNSQIAYFCLFSYFSITITFMKGGIVMDIGTQIRNLIDQEGITQKQLAEELNISTTTLNGYIQNRRQPDAKMAIRLAAYFNTTLDYIYGLTTLREPPVSPYNAEERRLVDIYRELPEELRILYEATGRTFSKMGRKKEWKREKKGEGQTDLEK